MHQYREGTVKRTPVRGVKQNLKPLTYKQRQGYGPQGQRLVACLLLNEPARYRGVARLRQERRSRSESESE